MTREELMETRIDCCQFEGPSTLIRNALEMAAVDTIGDLNKLRYEELARMRSIGPTSLRSINKFLTTVGLPPKIKPTRGQAESHRFTAEQLAAELKETT